MRLSLANTLLTVPFVSYIVCFVDIKLQKKTIKIIGTDK